MFMVGKPLFTSSLLTSPHGHTHLGFVHLDMPSLFTHLPNQRSDCAQQMVKSLKKAMAPVLSDVTVEWVFPETTEVLVSPVSTSTLFPGERLVGYGIVCDASLYISNSRSVSTLEMPGLRGPRTMQERLFLAGRSELDLSL